MRVLVITAALGALLVSSIAANAACTIKGSKSNGAAYKDDVTGQTCTPTAAEKATTISGTKSNSSFKQQPAAPKPPCKPGTPGCK